MPEVKKINTEEVTEIKDENNKNGEGSDETKTCTSPRKEITKVIQR